MAEILDHGSRSTHVSAAHHLMAHRSIWLTRSQTIGAQPGVIHPPNEDYAIIGKPAADIAKSLTKDWHPKLKPLFDNMNEAEAAFWKITCSTP